MTAAEQKALQALELEKQATWNPVKWANRIRTDPHYDFQATANWKAQVALWEAAQLAKAGAGSGGGQPAPGGLASLIQNVIYCAQQPLAALGAPAHFKPVLTADPGYASFNTPDVVRQLRAKFSKVGAWGVQTQIGADQMREFKHDLGLDFLIFQGETADEYVTAMGEGAQLLVGNANAWSDVMRKDAMTRIAQGTLAFAQEAYTNLGNPWPNQTSSGGVPAASLVVATYDGSAEVPGAGWHPTLADYKAHCAPDVWRSVSVYHAASTTDWGHL